MAYLLEDLINDEAMVMTLLYGRIPTKSHFLSGIL